MTTDTDQTTAFYTFTTEHPVRLRFLGHDADVAIHHDAPEGHVEIELEASEGAAFDAVTAEESDGEVTLRIPPMLTTGKQKGLSIQIGRHSFSLGHTAGVDVEVHLPAGADLDVDAKTGDITADGPSGTVEIRTASGDVTLESCRGGEVKTGSGDVTIDEVSGDLKLGAGTGDLTVERLVAGSVDAHTGTGDITIGAARGIPVWQDVKTVSGDTSISLSSRGEPADGEPFLTIRATTATGDLTLTDA